MTNDYLDSEKKQFEYYKMLGDKTFSQLQDDKFFGNIMMTATVLRLL